MPRAWVKERKREYYYQRAKKENYRSRAAYKLFQAVEKYRFIKIGDVVVDLGAAPGGWLQASRRIVGSAGFVLGVDITCIQPLPFSNVHTLIGDIRDHQIPDRVKEFLPRSVDVVVSDTSPNISGVWELDHARQIGLARRSLQIADSLLNVGGNFFVKVFQGDMLNDFLKEVKELFTCVKCVKPKASRRKSAERYVLGMGLKESVPDNHGNH